MRKSLLTTGLLAVTAWSAGAQIVIDTVSVGAGYANHKFYSLKNDEQGTQSKDNWDIAFEINDITSSVLANTQKANFAVYRAPYSIANYGTLDTAGIATWPVLHNSDETWSIGAFNRGAIASNPMDLGWGIYDMNTHYVTGDSCFVVKLSTTSYKKLKIVSLIGGVYTFEYANINGSSSQTMTINKSGYTGKNFVYFDMTSNTALDREPVSTNWDLMFGRYVAFVPAGPSSVAPYAVAGVLTNKSVKVLQVDNDPTPAATTAANFQLSNFSSNISTIGHDWKSVVGMGWAITNDTLYFVADKKGDIWKMRFTGFGGSSNGNYIFSKEQMTITGINDAEGNLISRFTVYPNPSNAGFVNLLFSSELQSDVTISLSDLNGRTLSSEKATIDGGLNSYRLSTEGLSSGVYFVKVIAGSTASIQKIVIQ